MAYGQGGTTSGYNNHTVGTGGYCQIMLKSDTEFPDYDYYIDHNTYYAVRSYTKGERYGN